MFKGRLSLLLLLSIFTASAIVAQPSRIVNAASFLQDTTIAPGSIVTIFGANLTNSTASAPDPANPPTTLAGVTLTVANVAARLFYVSPTQVNALLAANTPTGQTQAVLRSPTGTYTINVTIATDAGPGLFSLGGTGAGTGAILNARDFRPGPFFVTQEGGPTYLAIFVTGLDTNAPPRVTIGGVVVPVVFFGNAPCCQGLQQINVQLTPELAGAGRVDVVVHSRKKSNAVEVTLLPSAAQQNAFQADKETGERHRELANLTYVPNTSLVLLTDEEDDVIRVLDVLQKKVIKTIALPEDSQPYAIAVLPNGSRAVVTLRNKNKVALINLATYLVTHEIAVGVAPMGVAINGNSAYVVNQGSNTISIVNLDTNAVVGSPIAVAGHPRMIAIDGLRAYIINGSSSIINVLNLTTNTLLAPITMAGEIRPYSIVVVPGTNTAIVTEPSHGPEGRVWLVNLTNGNTTPVDVNIDRSGGSGDVVIYQNTVYFANQTGGSITFAPFTIANQLATLGALNLLKVDLGARALAVDTKDKLLVIANQGSGTIVLVDLNTNQVTGRINGVRGEHEDDDEDLNDRTDRDSAVNVPTITSVAPASGRVGTSVNITIVGTNLAGTDEINLIDPTTSGNRGRGKGKGQQKHDSALTVTNIQVNAAGTQVTATVQIQAGARPGARLVRVETPNGESTTTLAPANTFTVQP